VIKKERYLKFSITVLDSDKMATWLDEIISSAQRYMKPEEKPDFIYEDLMGVCAPGTYIHGMQGHVGLGMADYEW